MPHLQLNSARQADVLNNVFLDFAIPVLVYRDPAKPDEWLLRTWGGDLDTAVERMREKQKRIASRFQKYGVSAISRKDALFMYASQWVEWNFLDQPAENTQMLELMEGWLAVWGSMEQHLSN